MRLTEKNLYLRSLAKLAPHLVKEWDFGKNGTLNPASVVANSRLKVWWKCQKNVDHSYCTAISSRYRVGTGCPYCAGRVATKAESFGTKFPNLMKEWDWKCNSKDPYNLTIASGYPAHWICRHEPEHRWQTRICERTTRNRGCPFCAGRFASEKNNFLKAYPNLAIEWHPTKNGEKKPQDFTPKSGKKVWWLCSKEQHEWRTGIANRANGTRCPFCSGNNVTLKTSFAVKKKELLVYWDYEKNKSIKPQNVHPFSEKKVHWKCALGHSFQLRICDFSSNPKCRKCKLFKTSTYELRVFCELRHLLGDSVKRREKIDGVEADVLLSKHSICIEVDGGYWHRNLLNKEKEKDAHFQRLGIGIIRLRGKRLPKTSKNDVYFSEKRELIFSDFENLLTKIIKLHGPRFTVRQRKAISNYLSMGQFQAENDYINLVRSRGFSTTKKSLQSLKPEIAREWDIQGNNGVLPSEVSAGSETKYKWRCIQNASHVWISAPAARKRPGCPVCKKETRDTKNLLKNKYPLIAAELSNKNEFLVIDKIAWDSKTIVYWKCAKHRNHWKASVYDKVKRKAFCPKCSRDGVGSTGSIKKKYPEIASEWDYEANGTNRPEEISCGSDRKFWWKCTKSAIHKYEASVANRVAGKGCPYCVGKRVCSTNSIAGLRPDLIVYWDVKKNGSYTPANVTLHSNRKRWWRCPVNSGHHWYLPPYLQAKRKSKCALCKN